MRNSRTPKPKLAPQELFEYAVGSLSRRAQSTAEVRAKLQARASETAAVDEVIGRLKEYGYLDEKRFAENFATSRLENDRLGRIRAMHDLRARRVAPPVAEAAVERAYAETDEMNLVERFIRAKYKNSPRDRLFQTDRELASAYRRLLRAGFRSGTVLRVLKRFAKNPDLLDSIEEPDPEAGPGAMEAD